MLPAFKKVPTKLLGDAGEQSTAALLKAEGYTILAYNYGIKKGEVDIIAQRNEVIAFIEVKARSHNYFNSSQLITPSKQRKIIFAAKHYCITHKIDNKVLRFDVALVHKNDTNNYDITYLPNAFTQEI